MLVPGHIVALYVATGGQHGPGLGSDEKEVVLLVYVIIDVANESVSRTRLLSSIAISKLTVPVFINLLLPLGRHVVLLPSPAFNPLC